MKVEISVDYVKPDGTAFGKIKVIQGGYKKDQLPKEYLIDGNNFFINGDRLIAVSDVSPLSGKSTAAKTRASFNISLAKSYPYDQINNLLRFMQDCGTRLTKIKASDCTKQIYAPVVFEV